MSAYREQPNQRTVLFCPRCNELLDQLDFGVDICPRCEGFWIGNAVLELSGNQWPAGPQAWWRREVRCPMCAAQAIVTIMNARTSSDVIIDQCFAHGVWLDRGELARVMRDPVVKGLGKLREHLAALEPSADELVLRRERWHGEQEERARLAAIERKRIESERVKRAHEAAKTDAQRAEERRKATEDKVREAEQLAEARRADEARTVAARAELERKLADARIAEDRAAIAAAEAARRESREPEPPPPRAPATPQPPRIETLEALRNTPEMVAWRRDADRRAENERLERLRRNLERRVDYFTARIDSLRLELAEAVEGLAKTRAELAETTQAIEPIE